jgi:type IV secretory pathway VirB4 component
MNVSHVLYFARVDFRNDDRVFGIKGEDRFLHVYVTGKTGTGKSTLLETMALQDLERGNGFARARNARAEIFSSSCGVI